MQDFIFMVMCNQEGHLMLVDNLYIAKFYFFGISFDFPFKHTFHGKLKGELSLAFTVFCSCCVS